MLHLPKSSSIVRTTLLHVSPSPMTETLLWHGASVNALDSSGYSPLDICIGCLVRPSEQMRHIRNKYTPMEIIATAACLLEHGACITDNGREMLPAFLECVKGYETALYGRQVPENLKNPPHMHNGRVCPSDRLCEMFQVRTASTRREGQEVIAAPILKRRGLRGFLSRIKRPSKIEPDL